MYIYFILVIVLSVPFWILAAFYDIELLPGLPLSALMILCPVTAAIILSYRSHGYQGMTQLLKRAFDFRRTTHKVWYVPIVLLMPAVAFLSYILMVMLDMPLPEPTFNVLQAFILFIMMFVAALCEELVWSGYATEPLQKQLSPLIAGIILGTIWAGWHMIPLLQVDRSISWICWWFLGTVANRIIMVWLYNKTGKSVFAMAIYHAMINLCWQMFPNQGSHYDPRITSIIVTLLAIVIILTDRHMMLARRSKRDYSGS